MLENIERETEQFKSCKLYNPEKDECNALMQMYCKSEKCKFYINKEKKGWGEK